MRIEFLSTGNELLDGSVIDTNVAHFAAGVHALGEVVARHQTIPDELGALTEAILRISREADFVVCSGGMGPTLDDLTVDAAAAAAGVPVEVDPAALEQLRERMAQRRVAFTENNARQARAPAGAEVCPNPFGAAPMVVVRIGRAEFFLLPGVPSEFRGLCATEVLPRLERRLASEPSRRHFAARVLKTVGLPESHLDARVADLPARHPDVTFGTRTHPPENHLKLRAEGATRAEAEARLAAAEKEARERLADRLFGADDDELPRLVLDCLIETGATVAFAESCTGGLCSSLLTMVPGASEALVFSAVVYQDRAKSLLLGLDPDFVAQHGAVSAAVTQALAEAARAKSGATYGVAVTGFAGPGGGTDSDPIGTVYIALSDARGIRVERLFWGFERPRIIRFAAWHALDLLRRTCMECA